MATGLDKPARMGFGPMVIAPVMLAAWLGCLAASLAAFGRAMARWARLSTPLLPQTPFWRRR